MKTSVLRHLHYSPFAASADLSGMSRQFVIGVVIAAAALASGVAVVVNHPVGGDSGLGQIDIVFNLATNVGYF